MERKAKQQHADNDPLFIKEAAVRELLSWNDCVEAMESALVAATNGSEGADKPFSSQTPRTFTSVPNKGVLLSMPGFAGNYQLSMATGDVRHSTLACKLVTAFSGNSKLSPPLPSVLATILMFDANTGRMKAIIEGTEITAWRTASVSLVATKHLFNNTRRQMGRDYTLAICGTGTQVSNLLNEKLCNLRRQFVVNLGSHSCDRNADIFPEFLRCRQFVEPNEKSRRRIEN